MTSAPEIHVEFAPELALFVPHGRRSGTTPVAADGVSTLGHVVESLGVPLTEVGALVVDGREVTVSHLPAAGESVRVRPIERPQRVPGAPLRFLLDVHLGTLARRLRLLGVDTAYESTDIGDPALATRSAAERRVMLSRDRGLLRRRELWAGAYVYSTRPEDQLRDVLDRFRPELDPWTRCIACNGLLREASKEEVADQLQGGTQRSYDVFAQCRECGRAYWKGAHHEQLEAIVERALEEFADRK
ncbi:Mut7-C ubiquitin/RNAse domain-containing protein [Streptomyces sp. NBC_01352]|uniref:Mut7-C RNAse domain-containing protein n=1 Tax=unclassified Streptomyces TaxID=2593676 RepID=UPI00225468F0|nr:MULTISPECIES: Mut7-C RNAse domain-containing protein [unclassified Streptomyces]MCX4698236.1 Mut7-C ubiquitin/RNAse domain-containing protein [Streptomyces sp. NBC_01373]